MENLVAFMGLHPERYSQANQEARDEVFRRIMHIPHIPAGDDEATLDRATEARGNLGKWALTFSFMHFPETVTEAEKELIRRFRVAQSARGCDVDSFLDSHQFRKFFNVVDTRNVGDEVIVHGLRSDQRLNGESGVVTSVDATSSGRIGMKLSKPFGTLTHVNVKPENVGHVAENYEGAYTLCKTNRRKYGPAN